MKKVSSNKTDFSITQHVLTYVCAFNGSATVFCSVNENLRERGEGSLDCVGVICRDEIVLCSRTVHINHKHILNIYIIQEK